MSITCLDVYTCSCGCGLTTQFSAVYTILAVCDCGATTQVVPFLQLHPALDIPDQGPAPSELMLNRVALVSYRSLNMVQTTQHFRTKFKHLNGKIQRTSDDSG